MKRIIISIFACAALLASNAVMAQNATPAREQAKKESSNSPEAKATQKKECRPEAKTQECVKGQPKGADKKAFHKRKAVKKGPQTRKPGAPLEEKGQNTSPASPKANEKK